MKQLGLLSASFAGSLFAIASLPFSASAQTNFGTVNVGSSLTATVTVTIQFAATLRDIAVVTEGAPDLDFTDSGGGTCAVGTAYAANATCTVKVAFGPRYAGMRYGAVVLTHGSPTQAVIGTAYLRGKGATPHQSQGVSLTGPQITIGDVGGANGVAADERGNIFMTDEGYWDGVQFQDYPTVYKFYPSNGQYSLYEIPGTFGDPGGVAVDGSGNIYIADAGFYTVFQGLPFSIPAAVYKETLQPNGFYTSTTIGSGLTSPVAVAADGEGNIYVVDSGQPAQGTAVPASVYKETLQPNGSYIQTRIGSGWSNPIGLAVNGGGDVFITDGKLYEAAPQPDGSYTLTTIGSGWSSPTGVAVDGSGDVYVVNDHNGVVKETRQSSGSYTLSGVPGGFSWANGVAVDEAGNVYVSDNYYPQEGLLVKVGGADPLPLSFAGTFRNVPSSDSPQEVVVANTGSAALDITSVSYPDDFPEISSAKNDCKAGMSLAAGGACNLSISFVPVQTLAGNRPLVLNEDVTISTYTPDSTPVSKQVSVTGTEIKAASYLYSGALVPSANPAIVGTPVTFTATVSGTIRNLTPTGSVTFYAGQTFLGTAALNSSGIAVYSTSALPVGNLTIAATYSGDPDYLGSTVAMIESIIEGPAVSTFGDLKIEAVDVGGVGKVIPVTVTFEVPETLGSIAVLTQGVTGLDYSNAGGGTCSAGRNYAARAACTVYVAFAPRRAGTRYGAVVLTDKNGIAIGTGYLQGSGKGPQTTFLTGTQKVLVNDIGPATGLAVDAAGNIFVGDQAQSALYKFTPSKGKYVKTEIPMALGNPAAVAVDGSGNLYVAAPNQGLLKETLQANGTYTESVIDTWWGNSISAVAVDGSGNVYIADTSVEKETLQPNGQYIRSVIATFSSPGASGVATDGYGNVYYAGKIGGLGEVFKATLQPDGSYIQTAIGSGWGEPDSVAVDGTGNVYVTDSVNGIVKETLRTDGSYKPTVLPGNSWGAAVDGSGNVYIAENSSLYIDDLASPPSVSFDTTKHGSISTDSPRSVAIFNLGNAPLEFSAVSYPADFPQAAGATHECRPGISLAAGAFCEVTIDFAPEAQLGSKSALGLSESISVTTDSLNSPGTVQEIAVEGTETRSAGAALVHSPNVGTYLGDVIGHHR
jgi:streptogramin lyase